MAATKNDKGSGESVRGGPVAAMIRCCVDYLFSLRLACKPTNALFRSVCVGVNNYYYRRLTWPHQSTPTIGREVTREEPE